MMARNAANGPADQQAEHCRHITRAPNSRASSTASKPAGTRTTKRPRRTTSKGRGLAATGASTTSTPTKAVGAEDRRACARRRSSHLHQESVAGATPRSRANAVTGRPLDRHSDTRARISRSRCVAGRPPAAELAMRHLRSRSSVTRRASETWGSPASYVAAVIPRGPARALGTSYPDAPPLGGDRPLPTLAPTRPARRCRELERSIQVGLRIARASGPGARHFRNPRRQGAGEIAAWGRFTRRERMLLPPSYCKFR